MKTTDKDKDKDKNIAGNKNTVKDADTTDTAGNYSDTARNIKRTDFSAAALFSQIGVSMSACVLLGVFLGIWLDRRLGTSPWLLFIGALLGAAASFKALYDLAVKGGRPSNRKTGTRKR